MQIIPSVEHEDVPALEKCQTGIKGLDEVLGGGLPKGRPTLVCGGAGCGKTLMACEFLIKGIQDFGEPGVFIAFEETPLELAQNLASLGVDLQDLINRGQIFVDYIYIDRSEIEETGEYDLEGLFIRLASAIATVGAKRVVLDTVETIFAGFSNENILRSELRRLFRWLKDQGVTAIITGERGSGSLTRHGLEEYVSDCVILLDHRVREGIATRLLRVVKYRGSNHGNDEYPFLIDQNGIWVLPVTSAGLSYPVSQDFVSSGIEALDQMLNGKGYYRGSNILVSGRAGTGKTSLAVHLVAAACQRGERCLYFAYEESAEQIMRNMKSIGIDLGQWVDRGLLKFQAVRPSLYGSEMHLLTNFKITEDFQPQVIVVDPITNLTQSSSPVDVRSLMIRLIDFFKTKGITTLFTSLIHSQADDESTDVGISSLMDTWVMLREVELNGERNRAIYILKARGMAHSNQVREFQLTDQGIQLVDVYLGQGGVLTGMARRNQEAIDKAQEQVHLDEPDRKQKELGRKLDALQAQMEALQGQLKNEIEDLEQDMAPARRAGSNPAPPATGEVAHD